MRIALEDWEYGFPIGGKRISNLRFADDTTLFATSAEKIEELVRRVDAVSVGMGLQYNRQITKMMIVDRANNNQPQPHTNIST